MGKHGGLMPAKRTTAKKKPASRRPTEKSESSEVERLRKEVRELQRRNKELEKELEEVLDDYDELEKDYNDVKASRSRAKSKLAQVLGSTGGKAAIGVAGVAGTALAGRELSKHLKKQGAISRKQVEDNKRVAAAVKEVVDTLLDAGRHALEGVDTAGDIAEAATKLKIIVDLYEGIIAHLATSTGALDVPAKDAQGNLGTIGGIISSWAS